MFSHLTSRVGVIRLSQATFHCVLPSASLFSTSNGPTSFRDWLKWLEIEGMDEDKLNKFAKKEEVLTDMAVRGDPNGGIKVFTEKAGISDEFDRLEIQNRMLSKYQASEGIVFASEGIVFFTLLPIRAFMHVC